MHTCRMVIAMTTKTRAKGLWAVYVLDLADGRTQSEVAELAGTNQTTVGRWLSGSKVPTDAAHVAKIARAFGRNPLEAFVAAGMLDEDEAGRGLSDESRARLAMLRTQAD